ncbi:MAG: hypothetical protein RMM58_12145 [Chloroflexota bacterium]|nr:hypothetical protein [Dehalococcoidia bacterium]MDW8254618.1 hypothetical protein [Chloroflexota bacterium]
MTSSSSPWHVWLGASLRRFLLLASTLVSIILASCWLVTALTLSPRPAPAAPIQRSPSGTDEPPAEPVRFQVANTGGIGVYIRRTPVLSDHIRAWPEGAVMEQVGPDAFGEGIRFINVRDPDGNVGWVPAAYLVPLPPETAHRP